MMSNLELAAIAVVLQAQHDYPDPEVALTEGKITPDLLKAIVALGDIIYPIYAANLNQFQMEQT